VTFSTKNEGYPPIPPQLVTVTNSGTLTATGLSVALSGANDADFVLNTGGMQTTLPPGTTTFTVAPRTGLTKGTYNAVVTLFCHGNAVQSFPVSFTVIKLPAPSAVIDYENETLIYLSPDSTYVFNGGGGAVAPDEEGAVAIPESWMNGVTDGLTNAVVDPDYGALGEAQLITVPRRPAAPAVTPQIASAPNVNDGLIAGVNDSMQYRIGDSDEWIDVPVDHTILDGLAPGFYYIRYKAIANKSFASYIAPVMIGEHNSPVIIREVTLPPTPGVIILPHDGIHYVYSGEYFRFTLLYDGKTPPTVSTDRIVDGRREVLTGTPNGAGGYDYAIPVVREEIRVEIVVHDMGVETVGGMAVWAFGHTIYLEARQATTADIYTLSGILLNRLELAEGTHTVAAAPGVYLIVLPDGATYKVTVK
jgi:hypothetical protein